MSVAEGLVLGYKFGHTCQNWYRESHCLIHVVHQILKPSGLLKVATQQMCFTCKISLPVRKIFATNLLFFTLHYLNNLNCGNWKTRNTKCTLLTIFSVKYIHFVVQWIFRTFLSYVTGTLHPLSNSPLLPCTPVLSNHHPSFCLYTFEYFSSSCKWHHTVFFLWLADVT